MLTALIFDRRKESTDSDTPSLGSSPDRGTLVKLVLYAAEERDDPEWVPGEVTLSLTIYVLAEKFGKLNGMESPFEFHPSEDGPNDPELSTVLDKLEDDGEIEKRELGENERSYDEFECRLTDEGAEDVELIYNSLSVTAKDEITEVKSSAVEELSHFMLDVHTLAPTMFETDILRT